MANFTSVFKVNGESFGENESGTVLPISDEVFDVEIKRLGGSGVNRVVDKEVEASELKAKEKREEDLAAFERFKTPALSPEESEIDLDGLDLSAFDKVISSKKETKPTPTEPEERDLGELDLSAFDEVLKKKGDSDGLSSTTGESGTQPDIFKNINDSIESIRVTNGIEKREVAPVDKEEEDLDLSIEVDEDDNIITEGLKDFWNNKVDEFEGFKQSIERGFNTGLNARDIQDKFLESAGFDLDDEEIRDIARRNRENSELRGSKAFQKFSEAKTVGETVSLLLNDPIEIGAQIATESLVALWTSGGDKILASTATGIAVGAGVGSTIGGTVGLMVGTGVASMSLEASSTLIDTFSQNGVDINDAEQLKAAFQNQALMAEGTQKGLERGIPIAVIDALTSGVAGAIITKPLKALAKKSVVKTIGLGLAEEGIQSAGGATGEAAAQLLSEGKLDAKEIIVEGIGAAGSGSAQIVMGTIVRNKTANDKNDIKSMVKSGMTVEAFYNIIGIYEGSNLIDESKAKDLRDVYAKVTEFKNKVPKEHRENFDVIKLIIDKQRLLKEKAGTDLAVQDNVNARIATIDDKLKELTSTVTEEEVTTEATQIQEKELYRDLINKRPDEESKNKIKENPLAFFTKEKQELESAINNEANEDVKAAMTAELGEVNAALEQGIPNTFEEFKVSESIPSEVVAIQDDNTIQNDVSTDENGNTINALDELNDKDDFNAVSNKVDNGEFVTDAEKAKAITQAELTMESIIDNDNYIESDKVAFLEIVQEQIDKIKNNDITTENQVIEIAEETTAQSNQEANKPAGRVAKILSTAERIKGRAITFIGRGEEGEASGKGTVRVQESPAGELLAIDLPNGETTIIGSVDAVNRSTVESVNENSNGEVVSITFKDKSGNQFTVNDADFATQEAVKQGILEVGDVDDNVLDSQIIEAQDEDAAIEATEVEAEDAKKQEQAEAEELAGDPIRFRKESDNLKENNGLKSNEVQESQEKNDVETKIIAEEMKGLKIPSDFEISGNTTTSTIDVDGLNERLSEANKESANDPNHVSTPLKTIKNISDWAGIPMIFTISDQLAAGKIINPFTGKTIANIEGGLGFNGLTKYLKLAWASTDSNTARKTIKSAIELYNNNKAVYDRLWADGKLTQGHVMMGVLKMGQASLGSNEALMRVAVDNIKDGFPKKNQKKAFKELVKLLNSEIKRRETAIESGKNLDGKKLTKSDKDKKLLKGYASLNKKFQSSLDLIEKENITDLVPFLENLVKIKIGHRVPASSMVFTGGLKSDTKNFLDITSSSNAVVQALYEGETDKNSAKIAIKAIGDVIEEKSMSDIPERHLIALQAVDIFAKDPVVIDHPNYPAGMAGESIGILEKPVHVADAFGGVFANIVSQMADKLDTEKPLTKKQAIQNGANVSAGLSSLSLRGISITERMSAVDKLNGFLRTAFPNTQFENSQISFDEAMKNPKVKKLLKKGDKIYGFTLEGKVFINPELADTKTSLHEAGHIWMDFIRDSNPNIHSKGLKLVENTAEYKAAQEANPNMDDALVREEALMELMSTKGQTIIDAAQQARFKEWMLTMWRYVETKFESLRGLSPKKIESLTLDKFMQGMLADIVGGKDITNATEIIDKTQKALVSFRAEHSLDPKSLDKETFVNQATNDFLKKNKRLANISAHIESFMGNQWSKGDPKFSRQSALSEAKSYLQEISELNYWNQEGFKIDDVAHELVSKGIDRKTAENMVLESNFNWESKMKASSEPKKATLQSVESETKGLSPIERFKQGFAEFAAAKDDKIRELKKKFKESIKEVAQGAKDEKRHLQDSRIGLSNFIKQTLPKGALITNSLLGQISEANTDSKITAARKRIKKLTIKTVNDARIAARKESIANIEKITKKKTFQTNDKLPKLKVAQERIDEVKDLIKSMGKDIKELSDDDLVFFESELKIAVTEGKLELQAKKDSDSAKREFISRNTNGIIASNLNKTGVVFKNINEALSLAKNTKEDFWLTINKERYNRQSLHLFEQEHKNSTVVFGNFSVIPQKQEAKNSKKRTFRSKLLNSGNKDFFGLITSLISGNKDFDFVDQNIYQMMVKSDEAMENDKGRVFRSQKDLKKAIFGDNFFEKTGNKLSDNSGLLFKKEGLNEFVNNGELSNAEVIYVYNQLKIPASQEKIRGLGMTNDHIDTLIDYVNSDKELKDYAQGMVDIYATELPSINESLQENDLAIIDEGEHVSREEALAQFDILKDADKIAVINRQYDILDRIYGKDNIPNKVAYTPASVEGGDSTKGLETVFTDENQMVNIISNNAKNRVKGGILNISNDDLMLNSYVDGMMRMKNKMSVYRQLNSTFNKETMNFITERLGSTIADNLKNSMLMSVAGKANVDAYRNANASGIESWLMGANSTVMFLNTSSALTQLTSFANFAFESLDDPMSFFKIIGTSFQNNPEVRLARKRLQNKGWVINRMEKGSSSLELSNINTSDRVGNVIKDVANFGYKPTKMMDMAAILGGGSALWVQYEKQQFKKYKADGIIDESAKRLAEEDADTFVFNAAQEGQQSSLDSRLSSQQANPKSKFFLSFMTTPIQMNRIMVNSMKDIYNGRGNNINNIGKIIGIWGIQNIAYNAIAQGFKSFYPEDEEIGENEETAKFLNRTLNGFMAGFGIYGMAAAALKNVAYDAALQLASSGGESGRSDLQKKMLDLLTLDDAKVRYSSFADILNDSLTSLVPSAKIKLRSVGNMFEELKKGDGIGYAEAVANLIEVTSNLPADKAISVGRQLTDSMGLFVEEQMDSGERMLRLLNLLKEYQVGTEAERNAKIKSALDTKKKEGAAEIRQQKSLGKATSNSNNPAAIKINKRINSILSRLDKLKQ